MAFSGFFINFKSVNDFFNYKIVIGENPEGRGLTYKELDKIISKKIENSIFAIENKESVNKNFDSFNEKDEEIFNEYVNNNNKIEKLMNTIYEKNKYKKHK